MDRFGRFGVARAPLLAVGLFAAVVIAERLQLWQSGQGLPALLLMVTLPLVCAGLGAIGGRWLTELDRGLAVRLLVGVAVLCGGWGFLVIQTASWAVLREAGLVALLLAPPLVVLTLLRLRPPARAGSLLARARERAHWCVVGGVACGGAVLALPDWYGLRAFYGSGTLVVWVAVAAALATLGACVLSSALDLKRVRRACREEGSLEPLAAGRVSPMTQLLDIGVGDRMLGEVTSGGGAYRACEQVSSVVVGDPGLGASRLARAHRRLLWGCLAAVVSVAFGGVYAVAKSRPPDDNSAAAAAAASGEQKAARPGSARMPGNAGLRTLTPPML